MAIEQPDTLRVVSSGKVVEAKWMPSGVPGLALVGPPVTDGWRLIHMASGRAVSRSAEHSDPEAIRSLAKSISSLTDWTEPSIAAVVPQIRGQLERAITSWRSVHPDTRCSTTTVVRAPEGEVENLSVLLHAAQRERTLLRDVVRKLRTAMTASAFADALAALSVAERELVHSLISDVHPSQEAEEDRRAETTVVVQTLRRETAPTSKVPTRPITPRAPGRDVAAS